MRSGDVESGTSICLTLKLHLTGPAKGAARMVFAVGTRQWNMGKSGEMALPMLTLWTEFLRASAVAKGWTFRLTIGGEEIPSGRPIFGRGGTPWETRNVPVYRGIP